MLNENTKSAPLNINLLLDLRIMIPYLIAGPLSRTASGEDTRHHENAHTAKEPGGGGRSTGTGEAQSGQRGSAGPGDRGGKARGRHSPAPPDAGGGSLRSRSSTATVLPWAGASSSPDPGRWPLSRLLSPCPSLLSRLSLSRVVHTEASGPAHDDQPCSSSSTAGAGNVYLEMDKHLQFKATQRQLFTPPELTCHLRFLLKFWSRCQPRPGGRHRPGPRCTNPTPHVPTAPP